MNNRTLKGRGLNKLEVYFFLSYRYPEVSSLGMGWQLQHHQIPKLLYCFALACCALVPVLKLIQGPGWRLWKLQPLLQYSNNKKKRGKEIHLPCFKEILLEVSLDIFTCVSFVGACLHGHTQGRQIDDETVFSSALSHLE